MDVKTVKIKGEVHPDNPTGAVNINESDFDPKVHELYEEATEVKEPRAAKKPAAK